MTENAIAKQIVDAAFRIHTTLGPGLLESVYHAVLAYELAQRGLRTVSQQPIPVVYGTIRIDIGFRADLIVEDQVIVQITRPLLRCVTSEHEVASPDLSVAREAGFH
jgi:GxxExxY protein